APSRARARGACSTAAGTRGWRPGRRDGRGAARTGGSSALISGQVCTMKIGVVGAGAIGGLVGARLALGGEAVTLLDLPPVLEAIGRDGLRLIEPDGTDRVVRPA